MGYFKDLLPSFVFNPINNFKRDYLGNPKKTYSGEGEDLILEKLFHNKTKGFYVDIGCYHPVVGSNTYKLFKKGWTGMNVDPNPSTIKKFNKFRKNDINLNCGISQKSQTLTYYMFEESAINSFSKEFYEDRLESGGKFLGTQQIQTTTLKDIFDKHLQKRQHIDFIDIDAEGFDLEVLKSNDWNRYKPTYILVEDQNMNIKSLSELETYQFLIPLGYGLIAKTYSTAFYYLNS